MTSSVDVPRVSPSHDYVIQATPGGHPHTFKCRRCPFRIRYKTLSARRRPAQRAFSKHCWHYVLRKMYDRLLEHLTLEHDVVRSGPHIPCERRCKKRIARERALLAEAAKVVGHG